MNHTSEGIQEPMQSAAVPPAENASGSPGGKRRKTATAILVGIVTLLAMGFVILRFSYLPEQYQMRHMGDAIRYTDGVVQRRFPLHVLGTAERDGHLFVAYRIVGKNNICGYSIYAPDRTGLYQCVGGLCWPDARKGGIQSAGVEWPYPGGKLRMVLGFRCGRVARVQQDFLVEYADPDRGVETATLTWEIPSSDFMYLMPEKEYQEREMEYLGLSQEEDRISDLRCPTYAVYLDQNGKDITDSLRDPFAVTQTDWDALDTEGKIYLFIALALIAYAGSRRIYRILRTEPSASAPRPES